MVAGLDESLGNTKLKDVVCVSICVWVMNAYVCSWTKWSQSFCCFGNLQSKDVDERTVESLGLSIGMRVVACGGQFPPKEDTKLQKTFAYKLGPILRQLVVQYAIWDSPMGKKY